MRLIDADKIKIPYKRDDIYYRNTYSSGVTAMVHAIGKTPTIEAEPVVHGEWVPHNRMTRSPLVVNYACSECGKDGHKTNFYPNCGADMRGDQNE